MRTEAPPTAVDAAAAVFARLQQEAMELQAPMMEPTVRELHDRRQRINEVGVELIAAELALKRAELAELEAQGPALRERELPLRAERDAAEAALKTAQEEVLRVHRLGSQIRNQELALREQLRAARDSVLELEARLRRQTGGVLIRSSVPAQPP
jgi:chromosome segregation ATPase